MNTYTPDDVFRIAKRQNNTKRNYLLVNPLQAKHIPVSPGQSLDMMKSLGEKLASAYPECKLVIGFAETATAIGAVVASCLSDDCFYIQTTREDISRVTQWIIFQEEHSHATEQKLSSDSLDAWIENSPQIIFVDDEISTGKTLCNMVEQLKTQFPALHEKQLVVASIINRVPQENEDALFKAGIKCECLVRLPNEEYSELIDSFQTEAPIDLTGAQIPTGNITESVQVQLCDPRMGVKAGAYWKGCLAMAETAIETLQQNLSGKNKILVLGTEECMLPAMILGRQIELKFGATTRSHATTRSPISICKDDGYPITDGFKIHSFYQSSRITYIYDIEQYDTVIVVTDSCSEQTRPADELNYLLSLHGCEQLILIRLETTLC